MTSTLLWSPGNEPVRSPSREISPNCGQLLGRLDTLLPCLYIAHLVGALAGM